MLPRMTPPDVPIDAQEFRRRLEESPARAAEAILTVHAADAAAWLLDLDVDVAWPVFAALDAEHQAEILEYAEDDLRTELVTRMSASDLGEVLEELPSDEAVDVLADAEESVAEEALSSIEPETADELRALAEYGPDTAGGLMATEFVTVREGDRLGDAVKAIRQLGDDAEEELDVFVIDDEGRPVGFIADRVLLSQPIHTPVLEAMVLPQTIPVTADQEEAAQLIDKYGLVSLGVVDNAGRLIGVVSAEDASEVFGEEAEEDLMRIVGTAAETHQTRLSVKKRVRQRLPLMGLTVLAGLLSARVLRMFLGDGDPGPGRGGNADILRYLPLIIGLAGNVGVQSSTILVRAFATGELDASREKSVLAGEISVGAWIGLLCGIVIFLIVGGIEPGNLGLAVGVATAVSVSCAAILGCFIPVTCRRMGIDPAVVAGPFLICLSDVAGSIIFVIVAQAILR
jgi:magnesium transporter